MYTSKSYFLITALMLALSVNISLAQSSATLGPDAKVKPSVSITIGGGFSSYLSHISVPESLQGSVTKTSPAATFRVMWHPGFGLNLGIQSGYTNFYSYKINNNNTAGNERLSAVPILAVWSMPVGKKLSVFGGFGSYLLTTHLDYKQALTSSTFSLGSNIALSYLQPISHNLGLAAEAEWMNAFETKDHLLAFKLNLVWKVFEY